MIKCIVLFLLVKCSVIFGGIAPALFTTNNQSSQQYVWDGEKYDKNSSVQYRVGVEAILSFNLQGNEKVLDIGCGNGKITALCADRLKTGSLLAIDISPSMINFANKNYGEISNLNFLLQDVTTMSFDQEFDFVYSIFCLHWVKDQEKAIKNIAKSLRPGGEAVLYISLPNQFNKTFKEEFNKIINTATWNQYKNLIYNHFPAPQEVWFNYARNNDLEIISFKTIHDSTLFENYDKFKQRFTAYGMGAEILQVMGQTLGNSFLDCYLENVYSVLGLTKDQSITWESDALILKLMRSNALDTVVFEVVSVY